MNIFMKNEMIKIITFQSNLGNQIKLKCTYVAYDGVCIYKRLTIIMQEKTYVRYVWMDDTWLITVSLKSEQP